VQPDADGLRFQFALTRPYDPSLPRALRRYVPPTIPPFGHKSARLPSANQITSNGSPVSQLCLLVNSQTPVPRVLSPPSTSPSRIPCFLALSLFCLLRFTLLVHQSLRPFSFFCPSFRHSYFSVLTRNDPLFPAGFCGAYLVPRSKRYGLHWSIKCHSLRPFFDLAVSFGWTCCLILSWGLRFFWSLA